VSVHAVVPWWRPQHYYDQPGRGSYARDGGGVLICQAIHLLDLMLWLCGSVSRVQAMARTTRLHRMESEDFVVAGLDFSSGAVGSLTATTADYPGFAEYLTLNFERASVRLEGDTLAIWAHEAPTERFGSETASGGGADPMAFTHQWHRAVIEDFVHAVRERRRPSIAGRDALAVQGLIEVLLQSAAAGSAIALRQAANNPDDQA
jgi:predicted dehydrogenase